MSPAFNFFLNMWIMRRITEVELQAKVTGGRITQPEYEQIIATPQIPI
jgi:hypothetical protein